MSTERNGTQLPSILSASKDLYIFTPDDYGLILLGRRACRAATASFTKVSNEACEHAANAKLVTSRFTGLLEVAAPY